MSSFAWMKYLESSPQRYDRGVHMLSRGRIADVYRRIADIAAAPGRRLLDIGCGTGAVALACADRGAQVTGIDIDAGMLEVARAKPMPAEGAIEWVQIGAAEIEDRFGPASFDAVVSCLAFSELSADEQTYTLRIARSRLVPGGVLVLADEVRPRSTARRLAHRLARLPLSAAAWLLTQTSTRPLDDPVRALEARGFVEVRAERMWSDTFVIAQGRAPEEAT